MTSGTKTMQEQFSAVKACVRYKSGCSRVMPVPWQGVPSALPPRVVPIAVETAAASGAYQHHIYPLQETTTERRMLCSELASVAVLLAMHFSRAATVNFFQYKTESVKGVSCASENKPLGPFYIPENQCSGVLYDLPHNCERLELVRVTVMDYAHVRVTIDDSLSSASVEREPNLAGECPGRATVRALLGCGRSGGDGARPRTAEESRRYVLPPA